LTVAGAALVTLEGQNGRLVVHAHHFVLGGDGATTVVEHVRGILRLPRAPHEVADCSCR
jgi:hypothetical protein